MPGAFATLRCVTFAEKLKRLTEEGGKSKLATKAGLPPTAISDYINKGNVPRSDKALQIAKALGVSLDWLVDDSQEWPPPAPTPHALDRVPDGALMMEVLKRYRLAVLDSLASLEAALAVDWTAAAKEAVAYKGGDMPNRLRAAATALRDVEVKIGRALQTYDVEFQAALHHNALPGGDRPFSELHMKDHAYGAFSERPDVMRFADAVRANEALRRAIVTPEIELFKGHSRDYSRLFDSIDTLAEIQRTNARYGGKPSPASRQ